MQGLITLSLGSTPPGWCYSGDPSTFAAELVNAITVNYNNQVGNYLYNVGDTEPTVDNRIYPWFRTESVDGYDGWYYWSTTHSGWIKPHDIPASSDVRLLWVGAAVDLETYDGGSAGTVGPAAGPFWEVDTDFDARIPMGPGTTTDGTVITVGTNAGDDTVTLSEDDIPPHYHFINIEQSSTISHVATENDGYLTSSGSNEIDWVGVGVLPPLKAVGKTNDNIPVSGSQTDVNIVPPVRGCFIIKRTARIYRII